MEICRGFTDQDWRYLRSQLEKGQEEAWRIAVNVFERRIRERFLACIETLIAADTKPDLKGPAPKVGPDSGGNSGEVIPGFAIMALCCLLVETIQSFIDGRFRERGTAKGGDDSPERTETTPSTAGAFKRFLRRGGFKGEFKRLEYDFTEKVRHGLLHDAETRDWIIWREQPRGQIVAQRGNEHVLNRTDFYEALMGEFEAYLKELRDPDQCERRKNFVRKMDSICQYQPDIQ